MRTRAQQASGLVIAVIIAMTMLGSGTAAAKVTADGDLTAETASTLCDGRPAHYIVKYYVPRPPRAALPLRCGNANYGLRHLDASGRWPSLDSYITRTVAASHGEHQSGTAYRWHLATSTWWFRVVGDYQLYSDGKPKGLITAYFL